MRRVRSNLRGLTELENLLRAKEYFLAERSFYHFVKAAWKIIEPGRRFKDNWHIRVLCEHLEACYRGEIRRLVINVPYRAMKSTIVAVMFPVWVWIQNPTKCFLTGSHKTNLATRDAVKSRAIIDSPWFRERWGKKIWFTSDQNEKTRYKNQLTGERTVFGTSSGVSGENADFIIIDDPHPSATAMFQDADRLNVLNRFDQEISNRLNDEFGVIIIIMQRLHPEDLSGWVMMNNENPEIEYRWEHLRIPFKYEKDNPCITSLGRVDPRTEEGELYWPNRFNEGYYQEALERLGTWGVAAQLQQRPAPKEGGMVKLEWFPRYRILPSVEHWLDIVQFWDTAQKDDELVNDPWVCITRIRTDKGFFIKDVYREWHTYPEGKKMIISLAEREQPNVIVIEDKSTGSSLIQDLRIEEPRFSILPFMPEKDKVTRLGTESPAIEAGKYWLPEKASWLPQYLSEILHFPNVQHKDQTDSTSMMLKYDRTKSTEPTIEWI